MMSLPSMGPLSLDPSPLRGMLYDIRRVVWLWWKKFQVVNCYLGMIKLCVAGCYLCTSIHYPWFCSLVFSSDVTVMLYCLPTHTLP